MMYVSPESFEAIHVRLCEQQLIPKYCFPNSEDDVIELLDRKDYQEEDEEWVDTRELYIDKGDTTLELDSSVELIVLSDRSSNSLDLYILSAYPSLTLQDINLLKYRALDGLTFKAIEEQLSIKQASKKYNKLISLLSNDTKLRTLLLGR